MLRGRGWAEDPGASIHRSGERWPRTGAATATHPRRLRCGAGGSAQSGWVNPPPGRGEKEEEEEEGGGMLLPSLPRCVPGSEQRAGGTGSPGRAARRAGARSPAQRCGAQRAPAAPRAPRRGSRRSGECGRAGGGRVPAPPGLSEHPCAGEGAGGSAEPARGWDGVVGG